QRREASACAFPKPHWCPTGTFSLEVHKLPPPKLMPVRSQVFKAWARTKKQCPETWPHGFLQPMPFFDRDEHSSLNSATRNDLWTLFEGDFEHLAKPSFCVLHLPCSQIATSTRCYFSIRLVRTLVKVSIAPRDASWWGTRSWYRRWGIRSTSGSAVVPRQLAVVVASPMHPFVTFGAQRD